MSLDRLSQGILRRDEKAFAELYEKTRVAVYSVCLSIVKNRGVAEELTQETFVTVWTKISDFRGRGLKTWLLKIAKNKALNELRTRQREVTVDFFENEYMVGSFEIEPETGILLKTALSRLDETDRQIVLLKNAGVTMKEIAVFLKIPRGTASWRYSKALKNMKNYLENEK